MLKFKTIKIDLYVILGFILSFIFFDIDGIEFFFNIKMEYIVIICCVLAWVMMFSIRLNSLVYAYVLYFGVLALSTLHNGNEIISLLFYAIRLITCIILMDYLFKNKRFRSFIKGMKCFLILGIAISIYFQIYDQDFFGYTPSGNWMNFLVSDNFLGFYYVNFLLILYINNIKKRKIIQKLEIGIWSCLCLYSLIRGWSVGALVVYIIYILGLFMLSKNFSFQKMVTFNKAVILNIVLFYAIVIARIHNYFEWFIKGILHKSMTLSHRTLIWDSAIGNIIKNPIIGYGTCRGQGIIMNSFILNGGVVVFHSHNYFLENLIQGGCMAIIGLVSIYYVVSKESKEMLDNASIVPSIIAFTVFCILFMGQTEMNLFSPVNHVPIIFMYYCKKIVLDKDV